MSLVATFVSASGGITPIGNLLTWDLGNQRPGAQSTAWFKVIANSGPEAMTTVTISDDSGETRSDTETTIVQVPTAVGLDDFSATQPGLSYASLLAVMAIAMLALGVGYAWQKRTS